MTEAALPERHDRGGMTGTAQLRRRHRADRRFRQLCLVAVLLALGLLATMLVAIVARGISAFATTSVWLDIHFDPAVIDPAGSGDPEVMDKADFRRLARAALRAEFPTVTGRRDRRALARMLSAGAGDIVRRAFEPAWLGTTRRIRLPLHADYDSLRKGHIPTDRPEAERRLKDRQIGWFRQLEAAGRIEAHFNRRFLTAADSREPELAGILGAVTGSALTLAVTLMLAFPLGAMAAVYLQEFAPANRWTRLVEVAIANLAAVPSIVFGLLGLAIFLNLFGLPRSAPLVGGMVLALMTMPTIIVAGRAALQAVPPSVRDAALALGASPFQAVWHHVFPLALPGMLTGGIIGMAQALGETAPLLMIGMVAFIADIPAAPTDAATVLPVQIFLWANAPERGFAEKAAAAIMVLLFFLLLMNLGAILLRRRFEKKW